MADDWHENYVVAPTTSVPWMAGDPRGVIRGVDKIECYDLVREEVLIDQTSAVRTYGIGKHGGRLALDPSFE